MNNNNILTLSCKWYINTFKNLPIIVLYKFFNINFFRCKLLHYESKLRKRKTSDRLYAKKHRSGKYISKTRSLYEISVIIICVKD